MCFLCNASELDFPSHVAASRAVHSQESNFEISLKAVISNVLAAKDYHLYGITLVTYRSYQDSDRSARRL